jgi:dihydroxyacetone kinase-like protein
MADLMLERILPDLPFGRGDDLAVLVSGLGATPVMELYILYDRVAEVLEGRGMTIRQPFIGNLFTSLEMAGVTLTVMRLDAELARWVAHPARCLGLVQVAR